MLPAATTQQPRRVRVPALDERGVLPLPGWAEELAPADMAEASQRHREALGRLAVARAEVREAEASLAEAMSADAAAAVTAVEGGKAQAKPPKTPKAKEEVDAARARVDAAIQLARSTQFEFLTALSEHREALAEAAEAELAGLGAEAEGHLSQIEELLVRRRDLHGLAAELRRLDGNVPLHPLFAIRPPRRGRDPLAGSVRERLDGLRGLLGG